MKKPINEIKRMQRIAGLISESEYQESLTNEDLESDLRGDLEKVSGEGPILDPSKLNALVKHLATMAQDRSYLRDDRTEFARIAKMLMNNKLADAAQTIIQLDTSPREIMYDEMSQYYPELWDILFDNKQGDYISLAKPKAGLPEKKEESLMNEASSDEVPLSDRVKKFIDKAVASAKKDGEFENLMDAEWFDNELIDELIDLFPNKDYDSASKEVMDYISQATK